MHDGATFILLLPWSHQILVRGGSVPSAEVGCVERELYAIRIVFVYGMILADDLRSPQSKNASVINVGDLLYITKELGVNRARRSFCALDHL